MREITRWQAYDGTIFDDEEECREYEIEKKIANIENEVIFYNYKNEVINEPFNKINPNLVYSMIIKTKEAINVVKDYFEYHGSIIPDDFEEKISGCWVWSEEETDWKNVEEIKKDFEKRIEDYNRMLKELENVKKIMNRG